MLEGICRRVVAPHAGAWIEICLELFADKMQTSRPTRARGLKYGQIMRHIVTSLVAPHAGAWIEIKCEIRITAPRNVAPHAGAWIEIAALGSYVLPSDVAPHAGAWIEIAKKVRELSA